MSVKILQAGETAAAPTAVPVPGVATSPPAAPTPSETIIRAAPGRKTAILTLDSGRTVTVRRLSPLDRMMAAKAIGSDLVTNALYANYALVACSVIAIDGDACGMPTSQRQIEALMYRLGDDFDELTEEMKDAFSSEEPDAFDPATVKN